ncbi:hypothetical protein [Sporolactobacillus sp. THM19-2]|uniref:hypothetical protein n=1 Tax=Sporolactobacillus sp. THM19-2 TaxID=2511171 RepID=UPI0010208D07|nr:hypothetical protein [Sporolactobacillus sp. THM19-2]RYL91503.1 hypothetical protein EWH91_09060 [Sporolactobacillus sp. THM19-2]
MIIVYLSLILVVAAVIGFFVSASRTARQMKGSLAKISRTSERLRRQTEKIVIEKNELTEKISNMQLDFFKKKEKVRKLSRQIQQTNYLVRDNLYKFMMFIKKEKA